MKVTNLATSSQSSSFLYEVLFDLTNPGTETVIVPEALHCEAETAGGIKYESFYITGAIHIEEYINQDVPTFQKELE